MADETQSLVDKYGQRFQLVEDCLRPVFAEFFATTIFVLVGIMSIFSGELLGAALAHGFTVAVLVTAFGHISGAHINPAVTLAVLVCGVISWPMAVFYVTAQLLGSIVGAGLSYGILAFSGDSGLTAFVEINGGGQILAPGVTVWSGLLAEFMLTVGLVAVILLSAVDTNGTNVIAPLSIGLTVAALILCGGQITGASMNPARTFGPAVVATGQVDLWTNQWIYWVGPLAGAVAMAVLYKSFFAQREKRW